MMNISKLLNSNNLTLGNQNNANKHSANTPLVINTSKANNTQNNSNKYNSKKKTEYVNINGTIQRMTTSIGSNGKESNYELAKKCGHVKKEKW